MLDARCNKDWHKECQNILKTGSANHSEEGEKGSSGEKPTKKNWLIHGKSAKSGRLPKARVRDR